MAGFDDTGADTAVCLFHEAVCCIPEYAGILVEMRRRFRAISGHFGEEALQRALFCFDRKIEEQKKRVRGLRANVLEF